ncbi:DUF58 domain-containing protein [Cerasicoccus arenae]|uniref:DUF58 domain-containing protein n=1 Tax=Cerasicoccus arenae TaxID=424488 RepID=A0A8J3GEA4_9BACT|nr:DUF58 domain-containing protein [Cerasicoccus arenae]MBK1857992.1 DUF58 domain-containing protein [Cerasicoccus arenae]GHB97603.1 hypothetical protein GCM10007047_11810 [Cerasicoccus arenae]
MSTTVKDLLDPSHLTQIANMQLLARTAVEGFLSGMHRSVFHGFGTEFLQYRNYTPGEDLKYIDWKVVARTDKLYTKVYQEETNMNCTVLLDCSGSMDYQGSRASCTKFRYAAMVAACIAYLAGRQGDNVGLFAYSDELLEAVEPGHRAGQLSRVMHALARLKPHGAAAHQRTLDNLTHPFKHRGIVILISDMLEAEDQLPRLLRNFRFRHCDVIALQVLDPDELDLPQPQVTRFRDLEAGKEVVAWPSSVRTQYTERMNEFLANLRTGFSKSQVDYLRLQSTDSLGLALAQYLHHRTL